MRNILVLRSGGPSESREKWTPDKSNCELCGEKMGVGTRHHCRCCFRSCCGNCTTARGCPIVPSTGKPASKEPVRLCDTCAVAAVSKQICNCRGQQKQSAAATAGDGSGSGENLDRTESQQKKRISSLAQGGNGEEGEGEQNDNNNNNSEQQNNNNSNNNNNSGDNNNGEEEENGPRVDPSWKKRIDASTRAFNDQIVNLAPFTSDYGLHFSDSPVYGMRIATVVGPIAFGLPTPDPANNEGAVAQLLCSDASLVPQSLISAQRGNILN